MTRKDVISWLEYLSDDAMSKADALVPTNIEIACGIAIDALKAQEPIKPQVRFNPAGQPMWCCGNCGTTLFFKFHRQTDDEDQRSEHRFCHYCGRKVKWDV